MKRKVGMALTIFCFLLFPALALYYKLLSDAHAKIDSEGGALGNLIFSAMAIGLGTLLVLISSFIWRLGIIQRKKAGLPIHTIENYLNYFLLLASFLMITAPFLTLIFQKIN